MLHTFDRRKKCTSGSLTCTRVESSNRAPAHVEQVAAGPVAEASSTAREPHLIKLGAILITFDWTHKRNIRRNHFLILNLRSVGHNLPHTKI